MPNRQLSVQTITLDPKYMYSKTPIYRASWGKELGLVNREARYIGVHFTLIYTQSLFSGNRIDAQ